MSKIKNTTDIKPPPRLKMLATGPLVNKTKRDFNITKTSALRFPTFMAQNMTAILPSPNLTNGGKNGMGGSNDSISDKINMIPSNKPICASIFILFIISPRNDVDIGMRTVENAYGQPIG